MNSILHIGIKAPNYSPEGMEKGFRAAGFTNYTFFDWQAVRLNTGILGCQSRMIGAAMQMEPDLIFLHLQNPDIVDEETAMQLSKHGFVVNYTFDARVKDEMQWAYDLAPHIGLTLFACQEDVDNCKELGIENCACIHSSCDVEIYKPLPLSEQQKSAYPEIVFIGGRYDNTNLNFPLAKERVEMVEFMKAEFGSRFEEFGMNWDKSRYINPQDEILIYNSCKLAITHNHFKRNRYCSDRQWRSISCGAPTICHYYEGYDKDFPDASPSSWKTFEELKSLCIKYLSNEDAIYDLSFRQHSQFSKYHTWEQRINQMTNIIQRLSTTKKWGGKYL